MDFKNVLKDKNIKITPKRLAVLSVLKESENPLDTQQIFDNLKNKKIKIDQVTVYRIIETLVKEYLVKRLDFHEGKFRYELLLNHHHHLVCVKCGQIKEVKDSKLERFIADFSNRKDFLIKDHALEFFGKCRTCI